jgi:hypothetical protein
VKAFGGLGPCGAAVRRPHFYLRGLDSLPVSAR